MSILSQRYIGIFNPVLPYSPAPQPSKLNVPQFKGITTDRPMRFLQELRRYRQALGPRYAFKIIIEQSLTSIAKEWWSLVENMVEDWDEFERHFLRRFWNEDVQYDVREKLVFGIFDASLQQKHPQYAITQIGIARELQPPMSDKQIIASLARHFSEEVRNAIIMRDMRNVQDLLDFLDRLDQAGAVNTYRRRPERNFTNIPSRNPNGYPTKEADLQRDTAKSHGLYRPAEQSGQVTRKPQPPSTRNNYHDTPVRTDHEKSKTIRELTVEGETDEHEKEESKEDESDNENASSSLPSP